MICIITGVKPRNYTNKNGENVKGVQLFLSVDNPDVFGKAQKDCFISSDTLFYKKNALVFDDMDSLVGRVVNAEWDVQIFGSKVVPLLISFEFTDKFYDLVERKK